MKNLRKAQETAFEKKKNVEVVWRGHKDVVEHTGEIFTTKDLRGRLLLALRHILKIQKKKSFGKQEETVSYFIYISLKFKIFNY